MRTLPCYPAIMSPFFVPWPMPGNISRVSARLACAKGSGPRRLNATPCQVYFFRENTMTRKLIAAAILSGGLFSATSATAGPIYTFHGTSILPCLSGCTGNATADITIKTNSLGALSSANLVDWTIVLNSTHWANTNLTPANSTAGNVASGGADSITASTGAGLTFGISQSFQFDFRTSNGFPYLVEYTMAPSAEVIVNAPQLSFDPSMLDQASATRNTSWTQTFAYVSTSGSAVPEPADLEPAIERVCDRRVAAPPGRMPRVNHVGHASRTFTLRCAVRTLPGYAAGSRPWGAPRE